MTTLKAGTKYGDFKGSVAADIHDSAGLSKILASRGLIEDGERIVGIEIGAGENHATTVERPAIFVFVTDEDHRNGVPDVLSVRRIELDLSAAEIFGLFKRLNIVMTAHGAYSDREYIERV